MVFGEVVEGREAADAIRALATGSQGDHQDGVITNAAVIGQGPSPPPSGTQRGQPKD